MVHKVTVKPSK